MNQEKKELIRLDATLLNVLDDSVFTAEIDNGHQFVAVAKGLPVELRARLQPAARVSVEFSPYDMSQARVVQSEVTDES